MDPEIAKALRDEERITASAKRSRIASKKRLCVACLKPLPGYVPFEILYHRHCRPSRFRKA